MDNNSFDAENHTPRASLSSVTVFKEIWVVIFVHRLKSSYNFGVFFLTYTATLSYNSL